MSFTQAWARTGRAEGGYADNPADSGGPTNHGITQAVARAHGFTGDMHSLSLATAESIAKSAYWDVLHLDSVTSCSEAVANELFDTGFLCGMGMAGLFLQRALNVFRRADTGEPLFPELTEDGNCGKMTVYALQLFFAHNKAAPGPEVVMLRALNSQQGNYLIQLARDRVKDEAFIYGWLANRVSM